MNDSMVKMILDRLDRMDAGRDRARREAADLSAQIITSLREVRDTVTSQNGRLGKLELWRAGLDAVAKTRSWRWPAAIGLAAAIIAGTVVAIITAVIHAGL